MKKFTFFIVSILLSSQLMAQLCQPTFLNGCMNWNNHYVVMGGIDWTFDGLDCSQSDHTDLIGEITAGTDTYMEVEIGDWSGCSVWIDFNKNNLLDDSENLYHAGNGGTAINTFSFNINVPITVVNGSYIMRVIASWGSDGFNPGTNGSGGCGDYQYGNFSDFTVNIIGGSASLDELAISTQLYPNPSRDKITVKSNNPISDSYTILDLKGSSVQVGKFIDQQHTISIQNLNSGMYFLKLDNNTILFAKE